MPDTQAWPVPKRRFLFLQGPISPFFAEIAAGLGRRGHAVHRINLCLGDKLFWHGPGATDFRDRPAAWPAFVADFLDTHRITDLVLLGEQRPLHRAAIAAAQARGIAVTVTDFGYLRPDWIVLERDGMGPLSRFPRDPAAILALAAGLPPVDAAARFADGFTLQAAWDVAFHLLNLLPWPFPYWRSFLRHHPVPAYLGTAWRLARRGADWRAAAVTLRAAQSESGQRFLLALQMETDFGLRAYSRFADNDAVIAAVFASFALGAPHDACLLVKPHPLDPGLKDWRRRVSQLAAASGIGDRVRWLPGLSMDPVIAACDGVVTVNSTLGLRAITLGCPTCVLGQALYDVPGLTWQGGLDRFWTMATAPDARLVEAFRRAIAACLHVRGGYYDRSGRAAAVSAAVDRLHAGTVNAPVFTDG